MAKKKVVLAVGRGVVVAGVALSLVAGGSNGFGRRQRALDEEEGKKELVLAYEQHVEPRVLKALGAPAPVVEAAMNERVKALREARRAARKERKALAALRKMLSPAPVVEKSRKGPPRGYVVRRHIDGRTDFIPVRA